MTTSMPTASHLDVQPPDVVPMRDATDDEIPTSARRLAEVATANGWTVRITYAAGYQDKPASCVAVRMRKPDRAMYAIWNDPRPATTSKGRRYITGEYAGAGAVGPDADPQGRPYLHLGRISAKQILALADGSEVLS